MIGVRYLGWAQPVFSQATVLAQLNGTVRYCDTAYAVAEGVDALVVGTAWPEFRTLDFGKIKHLLKRPIIIDTKNLLDSARLRAMGFQYMGVGRG